MLQSEISSYQLKSSEGLRQKSMGWPNWDQMKSVKMILKHFVYDDSKDVPTAKIVNKRFKNVVLEI